MKDPGLYGPMLLVRVVRAGLVECEIDPPPSIPEGYDPRVEVFAVDEVEHASELWRPRPVTQAGLPGL